MLNQISDSMQGHLADWRAKVFYMDETFKERMKRMRLRAGFKTQGAAADAIGCERGTVGMWEAPSSQVDAVGNEYLLEVAAAYKVKPEYVRTGKGDDGFPWPGSAEVPPTAADNTAKAAESPASYAVRPDADSLRTAMEITERVLTNARVSVNAKARADITLAVYDMIREGHGVASAERTVSHMLRVVGGLTATTD